MITAILQILGSGVVLWSAYQLNKILIEWVQVYRDAREKEISEHIKIESENQNRKDNAQSDHLKDIEGR